jgi:hypothetical protein
MPRYVVLLHETPAGYPRLTHFDLMLEDAGVLRTWALERLPSMSEPVAAERLPDHRLAYLTFEGELTGGRGTVSRVDAGTCEVMEGEAIEDDAGIVVVRLAGGQIRGVLRLARDTTGDQRWVASLSEG